MIGSTSISEVRKGDIGMNKAVVADYVRTVFNEGEVDRIGEFVAETIVDHSAPPDLPTGIAGQKIKISAFRAAFPDLKIDYTLQVAEGDLVAGQFTLTGTHSGEFAGLAATGKKIRVTGHDFLRVTDGKISEHWLQMDVAGMMQQLGAD